MKIWIIEAEAGELAQLLWHHDDLKADSERLTLHESVGSSTADKPAVRLGPTKQGGRRPRSHNENDAAKIVASIERIQEREKKKKAAPAQQSAEVKPAKFAKVDHAFIAGSLESRILAYLRDKGPTPYKTLRFELQAGDAELERACKTLLDAGKASKKYTTYEATEK